MKHFLVLSACLFMVLHILSCSDSESDNENVNIPYFDISLMGTWQSVVPDDTTYMSFSSFKYSISTPYFEQILWKPSQGGASNIKSRWYYEWISDKTIKRHQSGSDESASGEIVKYKISEKGDSLFLENRIYAKRLNVLQPI